MSQYLFPSIVALIYHQDLALMMGESEHCTKCTSTPQRLSAVLRSGLSIQSHSPYFVWVAEDKVNNLKSVYNWILKKEDEMQKVPL